MWKNVGFIERTYSHRNDPPVRSGPVARGSHSVLCLGRGHWNGCAQAVANCNSASTTPVLQWKNQLLLQCLYVEETDCVSVAQLFCAEKGFRAEAYRCRLFPAPRKVSFSSPRVIEAAFVSKASFQLTERINIYFFKIFLFQSQRYNWVVTRRKLTCRVVSLFQLSHQLQWNWNGVGAADWLINYADIVLGVVYCLRCMRYTSWCW
jgi:hypothetical protein